jgi:suppressor of ftsI
LVDALSSEERSGAILHISGESPSDDVTRSFEGGHGGDFVWDIPADHMGGTYWYHAHHHGSTYLQVSGGAFGQLIIDDANDGMPANVAAMTERQLVIAYLDPGVAGTGGDTLMSGTLAPTWTVNGRVGGTMCGPQNEWQHWRILLADRSATTKTVTIGSTSTCQVALLARDGVWRTTAPSVLGSNAVTITGASRADLAVRCSADSTIRVNNTVVANIVVDSVGSSGPHPYAADGVSTWSAIRPSYLRDLRNETNVNSASINMGARTVNGNKFDHDVPTFTFPATQVQQWSIGGAAQHPFHLHVYHMQALNCSGYEAGEFYDTMAANCSVRFDLNAATSSAYSGRTIMHCHILEHEDQGAMGWMNVTGGLGPPTFPADSEATFSEYYALGAGSCGDATCGAGETQCNCPADCGSPPSAETVCTGGLDEDCDTNVDCDDSDCTSDPSCAPPACDGDTICEAGEDCNNCSGDCPSMTGGPPSGRYCCGDGIMQSAEGNGSICDGNY